MLLGAAAWGTPTKAEAVFLLRISDGTTTILVQDNAGAGTVTPVGNTTNADAAGTIGIAGVVQFTGSIGAWALTVNTGESQPFIGSLTAPHMDLNYSATHGTGASVLTIEISDQGFTTSPLSMTTSIGGTLSGAVSSVKFETGFSNANTLFGGAAAVSQTFVTTAYSQGGSFNVTGSTPYSLTERIVITAGATSGGLATGDAEIQSTSSVPAPAGLALALAGLPVLGIGAWIRRRRVPAAA